ncbi:MAG: hypothetical protein KDE51_05580 [Anaerolineales bacterium]|nr:hypothetical protein [Anaerolineales bacterium]
MTKTVDLFPQRVGEYWDEQMQDQIFPIAAFDLQEKILLLGLPLWENDSLGAYELDDLIQKTYLALKTQSGVWQIELVVFGRWPLKDEVKNVANRASVRLVTLADIESQLVLAEKAWKKGQNLPVDESFEF